jgi:hypothetical protein
MRSSLLIVTFGGGSMRWKSASAIVVLLGIFGVGCTVLPPPRLPAPVTPPYTGYTEPQGAYDIHDTIKYVYGCSTTGSTIWASIDQWPGPSDPEVDDALVEVYPGYVAPLADLPMELGSATFDRAQSTGDVVSVPAGQCFTVRVFARDNLGFLQAGTVKFTLNW